jgi:hypothetical protein
MKAKTIGIRLSYILSFIIIQFDVSALAEIDGPYFAFEWMLATRANFFFVFHANEGQQDTGPVRVT